VKICIVKLSAMGDIIHAMVGLQFIKAKFPHATIDWVVEEGFKGILENNPHIDNILPVNLKSIKKNKLAIIDQMKLVSHYGKNNYDIVIDAQGLIKSAIVARVIGSRIVGSFIAGFDKDSIREKAASWFYDKKVYISYDKNVIDRNIKLIKKALDIEITKEDLIKKESFLFSNRQKFIEDQYIVFVVGASKENKIFPKEKFLELAEGLNKKVIVVWGNDQELEVATWLSENNKLVELAPKTNLDGLKSIIANADLVIGGDTGPTHMAWGLNIPSITIFGNTPEYRNTYITKINQVVKSDSKVDPYKLDKTDFSIKSIDTNKIIDLAKSLI